MSAGLLTYKLCDRKFDCERCPLDAALRGVPSPMAFGHDGCVDLERRAATFPDDRLYSRGHTWLQPLDGRNGLIRLGVDSFVASFLPRPSHVRLMSQSRPVRRCEKLCDIAFDVGDVSVGTPVDARVIRWNRALEDDPSALVTAPYENGWIAELVPVAGSDLNGLLMPEAARRQARMDSRRFRRLVALNLLANDDELGAMPTGDGKPLTDLRQLLGGLGFLALLRELLH
ncbi:MAG: hypothetical protein JSV91_03625 [Phycisphaerales bacterium]|nr:MAG: hypothetical protein JSV91_03625 [Phycisphaerales bacterium]